MERLKGETGTTTKAWAMRLRECPLHAGSYEKLEL